MVATLKVDTNEDTARRLGIRALPTFVLYRDGRKLRRFEGVTSYERLARMLEEHLPAGSGRGPEKEAP